MPIENSVKAPSPILLIRNDNIGDLICSIPAIQLIRHHCPDREIHLLVNSYNAPVVNCLAPLWVDKLIVYHKTKHEGLSFRQIQRLFQFYLQLRRNRYSDVIMLVGGRSRQSESFAQWTRAPHLVGYGCSAPALKWEDGLHEVEYSWRVASHFCHNTLKPPDSIEYPIRRMGERVALQITSRKPGNRWEAKSFAELGRRLKKHLGQQVILLWSPGSSQTPTHPGDDEKAAEIIALAPDVFDPVPTFEIPDLIRVLTECRTLITPDGGAMHLAAAIGLDLVTLFGQSDPVRWRPWTPPKRHRLLHTQTGQIRDIPVEKVFDAYLDLSSEK